MLQGYAACAPLPAAAECTIIGGMSRKPQDYVPLLARACALLRGAALNDVPFDRAALMAAGETARRRFAQDVALVAPLFDTAHGPQRARLFLRWRRQPPAIPALIIAAAARLELPPEEPALLAALLAGIAADVPVQNPYHNNAHFREVTAMMALFVQAQPGMLAHDAALCLLAAAAHDLSHDGGSNTVAGTHVSFRLEERAVAAIVPLMRLAGLSEIDAADVQAMIRTTDISGGGLSPHKILRQLAEGPAQGQDLQVPLALSRLQGNPRLLAMACLLSDADLAPSASLCHRFAIASTRALACENPQMVATDRTLLGFLDHVVEGRFATAAARQVAQPGLDRLRRQTSARMARHL